MKTKHHMRANIEGMLRHYKRKKMDGLISYENGEPMSDYETRRFLKAAKEKGWKVIPCGDCEGFDHFGEGCPGHPIIETIYPLRADRYAVELPVGYLPSAIDEYKGTPCIVCSSEEVVDDRLFLPPGSWQFLFTTKEATEGQAKRVVGVFAANIASAYRNYMWPQGSDFFWSARDSLQSLLKAKGCQVEMGQPNELLYSRECA